MGKSVFVSYCHAQGEWVLRRLVPVLKAGGVDVRIDRERFRAGEPLYAQMDAEQDAADLSLLVLSPEYFESKACRHEMRRAKVRGLLPVVRKKCDPPRWIEGHLYVKLEDDGNASEWRQILDCCDAGLGTTAVEWLAALEECRQLLGNGESINLVAARDVAWEPLFRELQAEYQLLEIDMERGFATERWALVQEILRECGSSEPVPQGKGDLVVLDRVLSRRDSSKIAFLHFHRIRKRPAYDEDFFGTLRSLKTVRKLDVFVHSHAPFIEYLPSDHSLSRFDVKVVELKVR